MVLFESTVIIVYEEGNHEWNIMNTAVQPLDPSSPGDPAIILLQSSFVHKRDPVHSFYTRQNQITSFFTNCLLLLRFPSILSLIPPFSILHPLLLTSTNLLAHRPF